MNKEEMLLFLYVSDDRQYGERHKEIWLFSGPNMWVSLNTYDFLWLYNWYVTLCLPRIM